MAFHNDRLPIDIEAGARGGPGFKTTILLLRNRHEKRNQDWSQSRGRWDVGYGIMALEPEAAERSVTGLLDFFYARRGRAHSFPFRDWPDYTIGNPADPTASNQLIGLGDGTTTVFQIFKRYSSGGVVFDRPIALPASGTVSVLLDGVGQVAGFTVNHLGGTVTFSVPPAGTGGTGPGGEVVVSIACEFAVPVRFDIDHLAISMIDLGNGTIPDVPLLEVPADEVG